MVRNKELKMKDGQVSHTGVGGASVCVCNYRDQSMLKLILREVCVLGEDVVTTFDLRWSKNPVRNGIGTGPVWSWWCRGCSNPEASKKRSFSEDPAKAKCTQAHREDGQRC